MVYISPNIWYIVFISSSHFTCFPFGEREPVLLFRYLKRNLGAEPQEAEALARELGVMKPTAEILIGRGVTTAELGRAFFNPGMERLRDPLGLTGMGDAAKRIELAIEAHEKIIVYGDYDVDGVCATSILIEYLTGRGANCDYYIPNRHTEGYGLNRAAVESFAGAGLLVTVDCGVTNGAEVARARELGMDVIVTDHHECPDVLPDCTAVVNPKRSGQAYGFSGLCGAGTALKLVQALGGREAVERALDLAALATVADIVPLTDENRAIVRMGIDRIQTGERPGIQSLKEVAGLAGKPVKAGNIAFMLAPRINAGGRMDLSRKSVELMLTQDAARAREIAAELNDDNADRVRVEEGILEQAVAMIESGYSFSKRRAIVLYQPQWNTGVTGIVASRIVERYHRPTFLFGDGEGACYGSGRSVPGVHLFQAMKACSRWFLRYGGHEQAAGCALLPEHVELFAAALDRFLAENYAEDVFLPLRQYDTELAVSELTISLAEDMDKLEPCGFGNPRPVFYLKDAALAGLARTKDEKHLRMRFGGSNGVEGIAFRQGAMFDALQGAAVCDALVVPDVNDWMGRQRVQAVVEHIRPPHGEAGARALIGRARGAVQAVLVRLPEGDGLAAQLDWQTGVSAYLDAVRSTCWGTLALCLTETTATDLLDALRHDGLLERVYTGVGAAHQAARRENALVLAPDLKAVPLEGYDRVFLFDSPISGGMVTHISERLNNAGNCIIISGNLDGSLLPGDFSREELLRVYRLMKSALLSKAGPVTPADWHWLEREGVPAWRAEVSARIFIELELLMELDKPVWLRPAEPAAKADLNGSSIYRLLTESIRRCGDESEGQSALDTGLPDARHPLPGYHDAVEGRRSLRRTDGQDA